MISWFLTAIILTTAFRTKLASLLIKPRGDDPNSIQDLIDSDYYFRVDCDDATLLKSNLQTSNDSLFEEVLRRSKDNLPFCPTVLELLSEKIAYIEEESSVEFRVNYFIFVDKISCEPIIELDILVIH